MDTSPKHARKMACVALHLISVITDAIRAGDWKVDGARDPNSAIDDLRNAIGSWLDDEDAN